MKAARTMRVPARNIRPDDKIGDFTVSEIAFIADGRHPADPKVVLIKMRREAEESVTWFWGNEEVEILPSPYKHSEDDNVDSNLKDHDG